MFDLQVLALQADVTRVDHVQVAREISNRTYRDRRSRRHHPITAPRQRPHKLAGGAAQRSMRAHVSLFASFLETLKATPDGDGSCSITRCTCYGSGIGDPDAHDHVNLPILVAGGGAGPQPGARHIRFAEPTPLASSTSRCSNARACASTPSLTARDGSRSCSRSELAQGSGLTVEGSETTQSERRCSLSHEP